MVNFFIQSCRQTNVIALSVEGDDRCMLTNDTSS